MTAQPKLNHTAIAVIESLTHEGHGVAHIDGKATFVHGALPGEEVRLRYYNKHKNYDTGTVSEILKHSPDRVEPRCAHFGICGGCSLQHLMPSAQISAKQQILLDNLLHIGKVVPERVLPPITGPAWHYRRKARLGARLVPKKGGVLVGFREKRSSYITNLESCAVLDEKISSCLPALRELIARLSCPDRVPQVEVAVGENAAALVFRHLVPFTDADHGLLREFGQANDIRIYLQPGDVHSVHLLWPATEPDPLFYRLPAFDLTLFFAPSDFVQVNGPVNAATVNHAIELLALEPDDRVLDLFCGLGNFTLPVARRCRAVLGVEADEFLLGKARYNASFNGLRNAEFRPANLYTEGRDSALPEIWAAGPWDKLLLDPPRSGAIEVIKTIPENGPRRIVYISCYPATLARDSEVLVQVKGYRLVAAGVMDMFPQTSHVESIALFERSDIAAA